MLVIARGLQGQNIFCLGAALYWLRVVATERLARRSEPQVVLRIVLVLLRSVVVQVLKRML